MYVHAYIHTYLHHIQTRVLGQFVGAGSSVADRQGGNDGGSVTRCEAAGIAGIAGVAGMRML